MLYDDFLESVNRAYDEGARSRTNGNTIHDNPYPFFNPFKRNAGIEYDMAREFHAAWNCGFH